MAMRSATMMPPPARGFTIPVALRGKPAPLALLQGEPQTRVTAGLGEENETKAQEKEKGERLIRCRSCHHPVTSSSHGMEVNGRHQHTFPNPLGIVFQIGCFAAAAGCVSRGQATSEFSWFPGFSWCFALCANCQAHLGWHYRGAGQSFYGLIIGQLTENG
ncbi:MAG: cereblon family protein [Desulfobacteraceae bacterium]|nr:cereblon family protein [Desulfobacteraceae bacterium]